MLEYLNSIDNYVALLDSDTLQALESVSQTKVYAKGDYLLREGETCKHSYLIEQGVARKYYINNGKEFTTELYFDNDLAVVFDSYVLQNPGKEYIEALSPVRVVATNFDAYKLLKQSHPKLAVLDLMMTEYYAMWLEQRLFDFHTLDAAARYQKLLQKQPHIIKNIPLTIVASYLGISLETLSRIRARIS